MRITDSCVDIICLVLKNPIRYTQGYPQNLWITQRGSIKLMATKGLIQQGVNKKNQIKCIKNRRMTKRIIHRNLCAVKIYRAVIITNK